MTNRTPHTTLWKESEKLLTQPSGLRGKEQQGGGHLSRLPETVNEGNGTDSNGPDSNDSECSMVP